jgi:Cyclin-dependent kinase regulatory subunit
VILPKELAKTLPKSRLLTENEWRGIGVQQSRGWQHYALHRYVWLHLQKLLILPNGCAHILTHFFIIAF